MTTTLRGGAVAEPLHEVVLCDTLSARDQRTVIFYILYIVESCGYQVSVPAAIAQFSRGFSCEFDAEGELTKRIAAIVAARGALDEQIKPLLQNWKLERLSVTTRLVLYIALWELINTQLDTPIIIDEALELAKSFAETDAYKFVNGVLDEWVKRNKSEPAAS